MWEFYIAKQKTTRLIFSLNLGDYDNTFAQLSAKQARDIAAWVCLETVPSRKFTLSSHMKAKMPRVKKNKYKFHQAYEKPHSIIATGLRREKPPASLNEQILLS